MKKKVTRTVLIDDIDGHTEAASTVRIALADGTYDIDLSTEHQNEIRQLLAPFLAKARLVPPRRRPAPRHPAVTASAAEIRAWAGTVGVPVPKRGPLPDTVLDQYAEQHACGTQAGPPGGYREDPAPHPGEPGRLGHDTPSGVLH